MSNFSPKHKLTPNTPEEQVEILKAVIDKKKVFFYRYESFGSRFRPEIFNGTMPAFHLYHYDLTGSKMLQRAALTVNEDDFIKGAIKNVTFTQFGDTANNYDLLLALENDVLHVYANSKKNVVLHHDNVIAEPKPASFKELKTAPTAVVTKSAPVPLTSVKSILRREKRNASWHRTGKHRGEKIYFDSGNHFNHRVYTLLICLDDCVLVSNTRVPGTQLRKSISANINVRGRDEIYLNNIHFRVIRK